MTYLILVRHAKSEWNSLGLWTGLTDVSLSEEGKAEARQTAQHLQNIPIHKTLSSNLKRTVETLDLIKEELKLHHLPTERHEALNERNYGIYTGKNKWQIKAEVGEEVFKKMRRGWDHPMPEGETLKDVHTRVVPFYKEKIHPELQNGSNILVVAHGNSLRALVKHLENLTEEEVSDLEIGIAEAYVYSIDKDGRIIEKEIRSENKNRGKI